MLIFKTGRMDSTATDIKKTERLFGKDYILIMLASTGTAFCNYFFFTALPLYAEKISGSSVYGGLMLTVYSFAALLARPFAGVISDRFGRVRLLIFGALICSLSCALYGLTSAIAVVLAVRVLNGLGFGMHSTSAGAVAADVIPKSRMAEGIGYFGLYSTVAAAFAPLVALSIVGGGEMRDFRLLFFVAAGICLASMVFDCLISYERKAKKYARAGHIAAAEKPAEGDLPKTFLGFEYAVFLPAAVLVLMFFAGSSVNTFLALFAQEKSLGNIGLFYTFNAAGTFLSRLIFGKLTDRRGPDVVVVPGAVGIALCLVAIPLVSSPGLLFALGLPLGLCGGAVYPAINSIIFKRCSPQRRGTASAAYFSSIDIGFTIGGLAFGVLSEQFGYGIVYFSAAALTLAALVLYLAFVAERRRGIKPVGE